MCLSPATHLSGDPVLPLLPLIRSAQSGDLAAFGELIQQTQHTVHAACYRVLNDHAEALDATQETYLRAVSRLADLRDPDAFAGWLRRIAITTAQNLRRKRRFAFHTADELAEIPVLDESETTWTGAQRLALAHALVQLSTEDRRLCDRFYHAGWSTTRLAADAAVSEPALRKRLSRIRQHLREEIEMAEHATAAAFPLPPNVPAHVGELLARPRLIDFPENPVGRVADLLRSRYAAFTPIDVAEVIDLPRARKIIGPDPHHLPAEHIHFLNGEQFLRYDLTLPLLIAAENRGAPLRLCTTGQVYRNQCPSPMRDQSFHQFEILLLDETAALDPWAFMGATLHALADLLPTRSPRIDRIEFPACTRAWEISVTTDRGDLTVLS
jgi:RNA polymerase sigma-70 factor (ECF subfamily)